MRLTLLRNSGLEDSLDFWDLSVKTAADANSLADEPSRDLRYWWLFKSLALLLRSFLWDEELELVDVLVVGSGALMTWIPEEEAAEDLGGYIYVVDKAGCRIATFIKSRWNRANASCEIVGCRWSRSQVVSRSRRSGSNFNRFKIRLTRTGVPGLGQAGVEPLWPCKRSSFRNVGGCNIRDTSSIKRPWYSKCMSKLSSQHVSGWRAAGSLGSRCLQRNQWRTGQVSPCACVTSSHHNEINS